MKIESAHFISLSQHITHFDVLEVRIEVALELTEEVLCKDGGLITLMGLSKNIVKHLLK